jgi:hypothetical protein
MMGRGWWKIVDERSTMVRTSRDEGIDRKSVFLAGSPHREIAWEGITERNTDDDSNMRAGTFTSFTGFTLRCPGLLLHRFSLFSSTTCPPLSF